MAKQRFRDIKKGKSASAKTAPGKSKRETTSDIPTRGIRIKAFITDSFMLVMPLMYIVFYLVMNGREGFAANKLLGWVYIIVPLVFIQIAFIAKASQTPGMRAYNIKVVDSKTLDRPTFGQVVFRQILTLLSLFTFGWVTMFFRADNRMLHELLSRTTMVNTKDPIKTKKQT